MLTGSLPFQEKSLQRLLARQIFAQPEPVRKKAPGIRISAHLERLIGRLMAKRKEDRFSSMREVVQGLDRELEQSKSTALVVAPVVLVSVSIGVGAFYLKHRDDPP